MITGYNTDVRHGEVVFHVQTEDKGSGNPLIESLVYVGGQVIAARRAGYAELLHDGSEKDAVVARMEKQHRTMIAAIRHGKFDSRVAELSRSGAAQGGAAGRAPTPPPSSLAGASAGPAPTPRPPPPAGAAPGGPAASSTATPSPAAPARPPAAPSPPAGAAPPPSPATAAAGGPAPGASRPPAPPATAPTPAPPARPRDNGDRTLDQVILDYLASEAEQEQLLLILEDGRDLAVGQHGRLVLRAASSRDSKPVSGAEVGVRLISTVSEPRSLARGVTGPDGGLRLEFDIPTVGRGTAALIVTAVSRIGRAEIKQLL